MGNNTYSAGSLEELEEDKTPTPEVVKEEPKEKTE
jgi:hypothetical protein